MSGARSSFEPAMSSFELMREAQEQRDYAEQTIAIQRTEMERRKITLMKCKEEFAFFQQNGFRRNLCHERTLNIHFDTKSFRGGIS